MDVEKKSFQSVAHVARQYEAWPYPRIPLFARLDREQLWQINAAWLAHQCQRKIVEAPQIWIAGCGTFQPYAFSRANPGSEILATDISQSSLSLAEARCRWHRARNVRFQQVDLSQLEHYPTGPFDLIECYGVLMCLPNPAEALQALAQRLSPNGILRLMVYPHYGRQRIFQIQTLAKLLGLHYGDKSHPARLRKIMCGLPRSHPLSYAFRTYSDSANFQGIVDGFLHASDRGFTGIELCRMADNAGLQLGFCMHRPWGEPSMMAERLKLGAQDPAFWLHYLDLWQNLRTNFILCLVKKDAEATSENFSHPLFQLTNRTLGVRDKARLLRMAVTGGKLQSRTREGMVSLSGRTVRGILRGDSTVLEEEHLSGLLFAGTSDCIVPNPHFVPRIGDRVPNPLYAHLFDAYVFNRQWNAVLQTKLPDLGEQVSRWAANSQVLENGEIPFGLTPLATYLHDTARIEEAASSYLDYKCANFEEVRLEQEHARFQQVERFLKANNIRPIALDSATLRQLWILLFSSNQLFLDIRDA